MTFFRLVLNNAKAALEEMGDMEFLETLESRRAQEDLLQTGV